MEAKREAEERLSRRGRKSNFTDDFEKLLVGYAIDRRLHLYSVSAQDILDFSLGTFAISLRQQRVSEILIRHHFSSQLSVSRNSRMTDTKVADDCVAFILKLRQEMKSFDDVWVMDETGLWSNVVNRKTYHFVNLYAISSLSFFGLRRLSSP